MLQRIKSVALRALPLEVCHGLGEPARFVLSLLQVLLLARSEDLLCVNLMCSKVSVPWQVAEDTVLQPELMTMWLLSIRPNPAAHWDSLLRGSWLVEGGQVHFVLPLAR